MTEAAVFACSICNEPSTDICVYCTEDACRNHRCMRCKRCSDCCECDVPLTAPEPDTVAAPVHASAAEPVAMEMPAPAGLDAEMDEPVEPEEPEEAGEAEGEITETETAKAPLSPETELPDLWAPEKPARPHQDPFETKASEEPAN